MDGRASRRRGAPPRAGSAHAAVLHAGDLVRDCVSTRIPWHSHAYNLRACCHWRRTLLQVCLVCEPNGSYLSSLSFASNTVVVFDSQQGRAAAAPGALPALSSAAGRSPHATPTHAQAHTPACDDFRNTSVFRFLQVRGVVVTAKPLWWPTVTHVRACASTESRGQQCRSPAGSRSNRVRPSCVPGAPCHGALACSLPAVRVPVRREFAPSGAAGSD